MRATGPLSGDLALCHPCRGYPASAAVRARTPRTHFALHSALRHFPAHDRETARSTNTVITAVDANSRVRTTTNAAPGRIADAGAARARKASDSIATPAHTNASADAPTRRSP